MKIYNNQDNKELIATYMTIKDIKPQQDYMVVLFYGKDRNMYNEKGKFA